MWDFPQRMIEIGQFLVYKKMVVANPDATNHYPTIEGVLL
jgi:hypothetical protein